MKYLFIYLICNLFQKYNFWLAFWYFINHLHFIYSAKILGIFTNHARSHLIFNRQVMYSLAKAGHHVTFVSDYQESNAPINFTYVVQKMVRADNPSDDILKTDFKSLSCIQYFNVLRQRFFPCCSYVMKNPVIQVSYFLSSVVFTKYSFHITDLFILFYVTWISSGINFIHLGLTLQVLHSGASFSIIVIYTHFHNY